MILYVHGPKWPKNMVKCDKMISEEQFKWIEEYFGHEVFNNPFISINSTEYVKDGKYGVISFMNEGDSNFFKTILTLLAEFIIQYEAVMTKVESHQADYGDFIDICFMEII